MRGQKCRFYNLEAAAFDGVRWGEGAQVKILYYESFVGKEEVLLLENAYCRKL